MRTFRSLEEIPEGFGPSVVTVGNFDGLHLGHRQIMKRTTDLARAEGLTSCVLTFDPHPAAILTPEKAKLQIMTPGMRLSAIEALGIDAVLLLPFSLDFARLSPEEFVTRVLVGALRARQVLVGKDFRFGHKQSGDIDTLRALGLRNQFRVEPMEAVLFRGERVSSTAIRQHLSRGEASRACRLLCGPFQLSGPVVPGQGIGSKQTVPTLNLAPENPLRPRVGVYVTRTRDLGDGRQWRSITNVGYRPTFGGEEMTVETFLLDPLTGETPSRISVAFLCRVRDETRFESPEQLKAQILRDVQFAVRLHRRLDRLGGSKPEQMG